jgi:hypothetical protein
VIGRPTMVYLLVVLGVSTRKGKLTDQTLPAENQSTVFFTKMVQDASNSCNILESILLST